VRTEGPLSAITPGSTRFAGESFQFSCDTLRIKRRRRRGSHYLTTVVRPPAAKRNAISWGTSVREGIFLPGFMEKKNAIKRQYPEIVDVWPLPAGRRFHKTLMIVSYHSRKILNSRGQRAEKKKKKTLKKIS